MYFGSVLEVYKKGWEMLIGSLALGLWWQSTSWWEYVANKAIHFIVWEQKKAREANIPQSPSSRHLPSHLPKVSS